MEKKEKISEDGKLYEVTYTESQRVEITGYAHVVSIISDHLIDIHPDEYEAIADSIARDLDNNNLI